MHSLCTRYALVMHSCLPSPRSCCCVGFRAPRQVKRYCRRVAGRPSQAQHLDNRGLPRARDATRARTPVTRIHACCGSHFPSISICCLSICLSNLLCLSIRSVSCAPKSMFRSSFVRLSHSGRTHMYKLPYACLLRPRIVHVRSDFGS